jgi:hypothetical protein
MNSFQTVYQSKVGGKNSGWLNPLSLYRIIKSIMTEYQMYRIKVIKEIMNDDRVNKYEIENTLEIAEPVEEQSSSGTLYVYTVTEPDRKKLVDLLDQHVIPYQSEKIPFGE